MRKYFEKMGTNIYATPTRGVNNQFWILFPSEWPGFPVFRTFGKNVSKFVILDNPKITGYDVAWWVVKYDNFFVIMLEFECCRIFDAQYISVVKYISKLSNLT